MKNQIFTMNGLSDKLEILLQNRIIKDKTFVKQLQEIQLHEKGDGNKLYNLV